MLWNPIHRLSCCTNSEPCDVGGGDCDSDSHCMAGLKCGNNNCKRDFSSSGSNWARSADCCETAPTTTTSAPAPPCSGDPTTDWACCTSSSPCDIGGGDRDSDCMAGLTCGNNNCLRDYSSTGSNWARAADCCEGTAAPTTAAPTAAPTTAAPTAAPTTAPTTAPPAAPTTAPPAPTTCGVKPHSIVGGGEVTP